MKFQLVQLQDIVDFPPKATLKRGGDYPFIEMGDINSDSRYVRNRTQKQYTSSGSAKFADKDILFARITPCLENGKIAQAILPQVKMGFGSTEFFVFRAKPDKMDQTFLYYLSKSDLLWKSAVNSMVGASGRQRADATFLKRLRFYIPAIGDQKKIAAILSAYDDLIENNNRRIAILEKMAEEIYKEWFVRMRFPGHEEAEFVKGIPENWEIKKLERFCGKVTDGTHDTPKPTSKGYYLVTGKNIKEGFINFNNAYQISEQDHLAISRRSGLVSGDILFSNIGTLGSMAIVDDIIQYSVKNVIIFKPRNIIQSVYLYYMLKEKYVLEQLLLLSSGASQQFISLGVARGYKIFDPGVTLIKKFYQVVNPLITQKKNLNNQSNILKQTRDRLLTRLISGKLSVADLDIRFPRSMREESDAELHP